MPKHTIEAVINPNIPPTKLGQHWINTASKRHWLSVGDETIGDWLEQTESVTLADGDRGDITVSASGDVWTIDNATVSLSKMANIATQRFIGRTTSGTGVPEALTPTQATAILDTFTATLKGLVPASGGGTTNFLRADGSWVAAGSPLADGDKGDITVSSSGATWTIDNDVVTYAKLQNVSATDKILGRSTPGAGDVEEITCTSAARSILDDASVDAILTTLGGTAYTGTGGVARATSPTFITPTLGVASATSIDVGNSGYFTIGTSSSGFRIAKSGSSLMFYRGDASDYANAVQCYSYYAHGGGYKTDSLSSVSWSDTAYSAGSTADVLLSRIGAGHLGLSNGSNAQCFSVYNVSGTDYERGVFDWQTTSNVLTIGTQKGGAGNARDIKFMRGGSDILTINQYGIDFSAADTFHIGSSYRPHTVYALQIKTVYFIFDSGISVTDGGSSGVFLYRNTAGTGWDRMQYGGTSSSFPATKRRNATLETRLADDSAIAVHVSAYVTKAGAISDSDFTNPVDGCHGYDTTNNKHYVRSGGVWKSSAAYT